MRVLSRPRPFGDHPHSASSCVDHRVNPVPGSVRRLSNRLVSSPPRVGSLSGRAGRPSSSQNRGHPPLDTVPKGTDPPCLTTFDGNRAGGRRSFPPPTRVEPNARTLRTFRWPVRIAVAGRIPALIRSRIHQSETPIERAHSAVESQRSASGRKVMAGVTSRYGGASSRSALGDPRIEEPLHFAREDDQRPIRKRAVCVGIEGRAPTSAVPTQTSRRSESRRQAGSLRHGRVVAPLRYLQ